MFNTATRIANHKKKPRAKALRCERIAEVSRYRHAQALFLLSALATALTASSGQAEWQPHMLKVGDGQGGRIEVPAQIQRIRYPGPGNEVTLPFGIVEMDNGELAMTVTATPKDVSTTAYGVPRYTAIGFSKDGGNTWFDWRHLEIWAAQLSYLGEGNLTTADHAFRYFSSDYGRTWPVKIPEQLCSCGKQFGHFDREGYAAVDYDAKGNAVKIFSLGFHYEAGDGDWPAGHATGRVRSSIDGGRTWQNEVAPPEWKVDVEYKGETHKRGVSEGTIVRAANGDLVAALRVDMHPAYYPPAGNDNFEGLAVSISKDDGKTWSEMNHLFTAGRHHQRIDLMPNGALVMTLIVRDDIRGAVHTGTSKDLTTDKVGADALVSLDNGATWNLDRRITLHEFSNLIPFPNTCVGRIGSVALKDGSVLSAHGSVVKGSVGTWLIKWDPSTVMAMPATPPRK